VPRRFQGSLDEWQHLKVLNYEMESATLFVIASVFGLKAAMVASAIVSRARAEIPDDAVLVEAELNLARVVKRALQLHFAQSS